jgi:hypothetical protein
LSSEELRKLIKEAVTTDRDVLPPLIAQRLCKYYSNARTVSQNKSAYWIG